MYSGTTFRTKSGRYMGVHQKIDRVARRHIAHHAPAKYDFPQVSDILHFEGLNGPDGIKRKSPAVDEPWHYIDPNDPSDRAIIEMINDHIYNLSHALRDGNVERSAFESAWLAHAIVDGLTPAHHYPLEEKLSELRGGEGLDTRISAKDKILLPGVTRRIQIRNNWEYWGAKGVMTTHLAFELGVATASAANKFEDSSPTKQEFDGVIKTGFETVFFRILREIDDLKMYEEFSRSGWTRQIARETKDVLMPQIIKAVTLAWYQALMASRLPS